MGSYGSGVNAQEPSAMNEQAAENPVCSPMLCLGCGACVYAGEPGEVAMVDIDHVGVRPRFAPGASERSIKLAKSICPTLASDFGQLKRRPDYEPAVGPPDRD